MDHKIGETAGKIWHALSEKGDCSPRSLATATKVKPDEVFMALGWLAREGKVNFTQTKSSFKVSINHAGT